MNRLLMSLFAILQIFFIRSCTAVTCYGYDGGAFDGDLICPGSNACCGVNATCESNRLCHNPGDSDSTFIRGPCAVQPYDPNTCAVICLYGIPSTMTCTKYHAADFSEDEVNGFLPRVTRCEDGSFCCDNNPQCCGSGQGVFLDSTGDIVSNLPSLSSDSSSPTTTTMSSTSSSSTTSTSTASSSSSSAGNTSTTSSLSGQTPLPASPIASDSPVASDTSSRLSTSTEIGLGVGIPLGLLVLGFLIITIWFQRRRIRAAEAAANQAMSSRSQLPQTTYDERVRRTQQLYPTPIQEMGIYKSPILKANDCLLAELPAR